MVGRSVKVGRPVRTTVSAVPQLSCVRIAGGRASDVSFELRKGEILGLTGLAGSGFEDILPTIYGVRPLVSGTITTGSGQAIGSSPLAALSAGIVYVPADRKSEGGMLGVSVQENAVMPSLRSVTGPFGVSHTRLTAFGKKFVHRYDVRPSDSRKNFQLLSGGNQQKVVVGKWLETEPAVVLLQDPTQGVDVGAREAINERLLQAADAGASVICATTDYEQLALICDRVLIIESGTVVDELTDSEIDRYEIALRVMQGSHESTMRKVG